jgi:hypothetical protein
MPKWMNNPWLLLGGAVAVYWLFMRPKQAVAAPAPAPAPEQTAQQRVNAAISQVTDVVEGETMQEWESRQQAFSQMTGQPMMTMNI